MLYAADIIFTGTTVNRVLSVSSGGGFTVLLTSDRAIGGLAFAGGRLVASVNHAIYEVASGALANPLAGTAGKTGFADGSPGLFNEPRGLAAGSGGEIYVSDTGNCAVRKISSTSTVSTVVVRSGPCLGGFFAFGDFVAATAAGELWTSASPASGREPEFIALDRTVSKLSDLRYRLAGAPDAPRITRQPSGLTTAVGQTVTFSVEATGTPTPAVRWQMSADGGLSFGDIGGATSSSYSFTATAADNGHDFRAVCSSTAGSATSNAARLLVNSASDPRMSLDGPNEGQVIVSQPFVTGGWAIDLGAASGSGVDAIHVWAFPVANGVVGAGRFVDQATLGGGRSDVGAVFGSQFTNCGFNFLMNGLTPGQYIVGVYVHSSVTGAFDAGVAGQTRFVNITIQAPTSDPRMSLDGPIEGQIITSQPFVTGGWAIDRGAPSGTGVDAIHVWAFPVVNGVVGAGRFVDQATLGGGRPDVAAVFGSQFGSAGFNFLMDGLAPGQYIIGVYAHSAVSGAFDPNNQGQTKFVSITIRPAAAQSSVPPRGR